jgi:outer membrane protein assembly factor BamA
MQRFIWTCLAVALAATLPATAQKYAAKTIVFTGYKQATNAELLSTTGLVPGVAVGSVEINAAAQKLNATGLFSHVGFQFNGQELRFDLTPVDAVYPAHFENFAWFDNSDLLSQLHKQIPIFHGQVPAGSGLQQEVSDALVAILATRDVHATIDASPEVDRTTGQTVGITYSVATPEVLLGDVVFTGNSASNQAGLDAIAKAALGQPSVSASVRDTLFTAIRNVYHRAGFLEVSAPSFAHRQPVADGQRILVPVNMAIDEGPQYRLGQLHVAGDVLMKEDDLLKHASIHSGDIANEDKLRQTMAYISAPYRTRGYLHARITGEPTFNHAASTVDYTIRVAPGDVYHMGQLTVDNLSPEQKAAFLGVWKMKPGDPYDAVYVAMVLKENKSVHILDGYTANYKQYEHEDTHVVDLVYTFGKIPPAP